MRIVYRVQPREGRPGWDVYHGKRRVGGPYVTEAAAQEVADTLGAMNIREKPERDFAAEHRRRLRKRKRHEF